MEKRNPAFGQHVHVHEMRDVNGRSGDKGENKEEKGKKKNSILSGGDRTRTVQKELDIQRTPIGGIEPPAAV